MAETNLFDYLMSMQPTGAQSLASALPFLSLPGKQASYMAPSQRYLNASINTDNKLYKKIYGQQRQMGQRNLADVIAEAQRQNRKASLLGRTPLFSAERGGEEVFRNLARGYEDIQDKANVDTRNILSGAADSSMKMGAMRSSLAANRAGIHGNLLGAITKLFGL